MPTPSPWVYTTVTLVDPTPPEEPTPPPVATKEPNWHGPRKPGWRIELTNLDGSPANTTIQVIAKGFDWDQDRPNRGGGRVTINGLTDTTIQAALLGKRVRPVYRLDGVDYQLGIFKPATAPTSYGAGQTHDVSLIEAGLITGRTVGSLTLPVATDVVAAVTTLAGAIPVSVADTDATLRTEMSWSDGTPKQEIIDKILASAGMTPLRPGTNGILSSTQFVPANRRPIAYDFRNDVRGIYKPEFTIDTNWLTIPNRIRVVARSSSNAPALIGYATDNNPQSPWSYVNRGEWVEESINDDVDATSQEAVNAIAAHELAQRQQSAATLTFQCAWIPKLVLGNIVGFHNSRHQLSGLWEIVSIGWPGKDIASVTARSVA